jgi:hypothetical protein
MKLDEGRKSWREHRIHLAPGMAGIRRPAGGVHIGRHRMGGRTSCGVRDIPAIAASNASIAGQRLLSEPPDRRGDIETSLAAVNNCRGILHALAAISDYPTRKSVQLDSDQLARFLQALAGALDELANSLLAKTEPKRLPDLSILLEQLESTFPEVFGDRQKLDETPAATAQDRVTGASLFYHLKNAVNLTLATREVIARLIQPPVDSSRGEGEFYPRVTGE